MKQFQTNSLSDLLKNNKYYKALVPQNRVNHDYQLFPNKMGKAFDLNAQDPQSIDDPGLIRSATPGPGMERYSNPVPRMKFKPLGQTGAQRDKVGNFRLPNDDLFTPGGFDMQNRLLTPSYNTPLDEGGVPIPNTLQNLMPNKGQYVQYPSLYGYRGGSGQWGGSDASVLSRFLNSGSARYAMPGVRTGKVI